MDAVYVPDEMVVDEAVGCVAGELPNAHLSHTSHGTLKAKEKTVRKPHGTLKLRTRHFTKRSKDDVHKEILLGALQCLWCTARGRPRS